MKISYLVPLFLFLIWLPYVDGVSDSLTCDESTAQAKGSICLAPLPKPAELPKTQANPTGGDAFVTVSVKVDDQEAVALAYDNSRLIEGLELGTKHLMQIFIDGTLAESFYFTIEQDGNHRKCLFKSSLYGTWQLWDYERCSEWCKCY